MEIYYLICNVRYSSTPKKKQFDILEWKNIFEKIFFSTLAQFLYSEKFLTR